ncbi:MAG: type I-G CRISPR-associated protein Csb2, partial [Stellaceae bacterium]
AFATRTPASSDPDWPPQPDRVFSALVAAWGARGEQPEERRALEWLEAQPSPELAASAGSARTPATVFVPPNDPQTGRVGDLTVMPASRRRQPRRFPAYLPNDPIVRLVWRAAAADSGTVAALNDLAADTPYIGHSASLTRCRFSAEGAPEATAPARRKVYRGRLAELERSHRAGRRPSPGADVHIAPVSAKERPHSVFAERWLVLEHVGGEVRDLRAAALVGKALRDALMSGYKRTIGETRIPPIVSGHRADGTPLGEPHLAIIPLAFLGSQYADGRVFGFALIPPGEAALLDDADFQNAIREIAPWNDKEDRRELRLDHFDLTFTPSGEGTRHSLDPSPYVATAKIWATCTPIVLDRHLKSAGNAARNREVCGVIAQACLNIGLPAPGRIPDRGEPDEEFVIAAGKHSAVRGAPSAYPSGRSPNWLRWRLPQSLANRQLTHAVLQFEEPVRGPVMLGAGRFVGLGLCRALDPEER